MKPRWIWFQPVRLSRNRERILGLLKGAVLTTQPAGRGRDA